MKPKPDRNLIHRLPDWHDTLPLAHACPRCGAMTRAGTSCRSPAMRNGRCRMHGGTSTGPRTADGIARIVKARTTHGLYRTEVREVRALVRELREEQKRLLDLV